MGLVSAIARRLRAHFAIKKVNRRFRHVTRFITEFNEILSKNPPPGLVSSAGVSLASWSREGDDIISSLRLRSLRKPEMTIPLRVTVGANHVKVGEMWVLFSDGEKLLNVVKRAVAGFFST
jgi:hypothetical protein